MVEINSFHVLIYTRFVNIRVRLIRYLDKDYEKVQLTSYTALWYVKEIVFRKSF